MAEIVSITGATGSGKSWLAKQLAAEHGLVLISTDWIRQSLRSTPELDDVERVMQSTYCVYPDDPIAGYDHQADLVEAATRAYLNAALADGQSNFLIEGIHLRPGWSECYASSLELYVPLPARDRHLEQLRRRGRIRNLEHFEAIRAIGEELERRAEAKGLAIAQLGILRPVLQEVMDEDSDLGAGEIAAEVVEGEIPVETLIQD